MKKRIIEAIGEVLKTIDELRTEVFRIRRLVIELTDDEDRKTPIRPPSQAAMEAFQNSDKFLKPKK